MNLLREKTEDERHNILKQEVENLKKLVNENKSLKNKINKEDFKYISELLKDEKRRFGGFEIVLKKINEIEGILGEETPAVLIYRKACIFYEFRGDNVTAKEIFENFLEVYDKSDSELKIYADRAKYYLIEIILKEISFSGFKKNKENFQIASEYLKYLNNEVKNNNDDEFIISNLPLLNFNMQNFDETENESYRFIDLHLKKSDCFSNFEIKDYIKKYPVFIEYSSRKVHLRGISFSLLPNDLNALIKILSGCTSEDLIKDNEPQNTAHKRVSRMKERIEQKTKKELMKSLNINEQTKNEEKNTKFLNLYEKTRIKFLTEKLNEYGVEDSEKSAVIIAKKDFASFDDDVIPWHEISSD